MKVNFKSLACRLLDLFRFGKDQVCFLFKCYFDHVLGLHLHYSQVIFKSGRIDSNDEVMLNIPVIKISINSCQFGLHKVNLYLLLRFVIL